MQSQWKEKVALETKIKKLHVSKFNLLLNNLKIQIVILLLHNVGKIDQKEVYNVNFVMMTNWDLFIQYTGN